LKKVDEEKRKVEEEKKTIEEVMFSVRRELGETKKLLTQRETTTPVESVEVGIQTAPEVTDSSTDPIEEVLRQRRGGKEKGKAVEHRQPQLTRKEDTVMKEVDEFSPYEDLSEYEKEEEESRDPPPRSQKPKKNQGGKPRPPKNNKQAKAIDQEWVDMKAFVVHGVSCHRPPADITQDLRKIGMRGIIGARWLVGEQRRKEKTTSSVVIFLDNTVSFHVQDGHSRMKIRGRWHPIEVYDFNRGRGPPEKSDW
jgi:hypothetical protein